MQNVGQSHQHSRNFGYPWQPSTRASGLRPQASGTNAIDIRCHCMNLPLFEALNSLMDRSQNILTTPQRHQQRARQAFRQHSQNVEESPRRRLAMPTPETPTPQPGYAERTRANNRFSNREARNMELLNSPRRRRVYRQDENVPPTNSGITLGGQTVRSENLLCFMLMLILSQALDSDARKL